MTDSPDTVTEAVTLLQTEGYGGDFNLADGSWVCPQCHTAHVTTDAVIERQFRFEGESDPGDEAIVLGVRCPTCDARGIVVSAYGPDADPALLDHLREPS